MPLNVAYFSKEFGRSEALPIYSGGLGILPGDCLKTASDLGVPAVGIGLLYQQGYFRQVIDAGIDQMHPVFAYVRIASSAAGAGIMRGDIFSRVSVGLYHILWLQSCCQT